MSRVKQFIDSGVRPRFDNGDSLQMRVGRSFVRLSDASGALTAAGNEYERQTQGRLSHTAAFRTNEPSARATQKPSVCAMAGAAQLASGTPPAAAGTSRNWARATTSA